jgi:hypothetical protein
LNLSSCPPLVHGALGDPGAIVDRRTPLVADKHH